jgi:GR25 family glycosyltransferase involved in LPS biosynthesis
MEETILNILNTYDVTSCQIHNTDNPVIKIPVYIINLDKDIYRRCYIKYITKKLNINYTLIIVKPITTDIINAVKCNLSSGVLGCYLSHMWCIKNAIENKYNHFLIFEDDIIFIKHFDVLFNTINYKNYDMVQLGCCDFNLNANLTNEFNELNVTKIYNPKLLALGAYGNIYNLYFAKMLFKEKLNNVKEFDTTLDMYYNKYNIGICYPNLITSELSTTNLQHNFSIFNGNKNNLFINRCFKNFDYSDYYFIWIHFIKYCYECCNERLCYNLSQEEYETIIIQFSKIYNNYNELIMKTLNNNNINAFDINNIMNDLHKEFDKQI